MSTEAQAAARLTPAVRGLSPLDPPYATSTGSGNVSRTRIEVTSLRGSCLRSARYDVVCLRVDRLRVSHAMLAQHSLPRTTH